MTYKKIIYGQHALERMADRSISRRDVRYLIARGERRAERTHEGRDQRWSRIGDVAGRTLMVVFVENAYRIEVITVGPAD